MSNVEEVVGTPTDEVKVQIIKLDNKETTTSEKKENDRTGK
jgi:5-hydroxyisourate hydrolase-like protein (transthyretin family)